MTEIAGKYKGIHLHKARKLIIEDLKTAGLLKDQKPITHPVKVHERCGTEIEIINSKQWFIKYLDLREDMLKWAAELKWHAEFMKQRELRRVMEEAGFEILASTYANMLLFPLAVLQRGLRILTGYQQQKTDAQPWPPFLAWLNSPFRSCLGAEAGWLRNGRRLPFGLSVICVARKPRAAARSWRNGETVGDLRPHPAISRLTFLLQSRYHAR